MDESLRRDDETAPLIPKAETPRQKKNRLARELRRLKSVLDRNPEKNVDAIAVVLLSERKAINALSESDVEELVGYYYHTSYLAFVKIFSQLSPAAKKAVGNCAIKSLKREQAKGGIHFPTNEVFLAGAEKIGAEWPDVKASWVTKKWYAYSNRVVIGSINVLIKRREFTLTQICDLLDKFPAFVISGILRHLHHNNVRELVRQLRESVGAENNAGKYPNLTIALDNLKIQRFNEALRTKSVDAFEAVLHTLYNNPHEIEQLQILIRRLVDLIGTSRFQGKYEGMMELALMRLAQLSTFEEGLNLDSAILKKCLGVVNRYFLKKNRTRFFATTFPTGNGMVTMRAYVRRTVPDFLGYKNLRAFSPQVNISTLFTTPDAGISVGIRYGELDIQDLLLQTVLKDGFYEKMARRLVDLGADMDRKDPRGRSFLGLVLEGLGRNRTELWDFYIKNKSGTELSAVLSSVVDTYIQHSIEYVQAQGVFAKAIKDIAIQNMQGCCEALRRLKNLNVVVTPEILEKLYATTTMDFEQKRVLLEMLHPLSVAASAVASIPSGRGKKDKEEASEAPAAARTAEEIAEDVKHLKNIVNNNFFSQAEEADVLARRVGKSKLREMDLLDKLHTFQEWAKNGNDTGDGLRTTRLGMLQRDLQKNKFDEINDLVKQSGKAVKHLTPEAKQKLWNCNVEPGVREFLKKNGFPFADVEEKSAAFPRHLASDETIVGAAATIGLTGSRLSSSTARRDADVERPHSNVMEW